jgi:hypothetical protein
MTKAKMFRLAPKKAKKKLLFLLFSLFFSNSVLQAQNIAINNNVLFDIAGALSAGIEVPTSPRGSVEVYGSVRPWKRGAEKVHKHWLVQGQYRIWPCQVMNGFFFGPYMHGGEFNLANTTLPFGLLKGIKNNRYEGWLIGGGIGVGYEYALARHWNLGAEIGAGYTYIKYKKYDCEVCDPLKEDGRYNYFGISRMALSLIYVF